MTIWFTSDLHFSHKNILKYQPNRSELGDNIQAMNEGIVSRWNAVVHPNDEIFILGDVAPTWKKRELDGLKALINSLHGRKHLVLGNHDHLLRQNDRELSGCFEKIRSYMEIHYEKEHIVLSHFAMRVWNKSHHGAWMLFGHSHGSLEPLGKSVDVGIDSQWVTGKFEMRPFSFEEIKAFMDKREVVFLDRHAPGDNP